MTAPILPSWFKQRQCKTEPAGDQTLKVSGPNLGEAFLHVRADNGRWTGALRLADDGPDLAVSEAEEPTAQAAWNVAFELYRQHVIT